MKEEWTMIRVRKATHARLAALRARLETAYQSGHRRKLLPISERDQFTLDALLAELLTMKERHLERSKRRKKGHDGPPPAPAADMTF